MYVRACVRECVIVSVSSFKKACHRCAFVCVCACAFARACVHTCSCACVRECVRESACACKSWCKHRCVLCAFVRACESK